ncbi:MAG TPA: dihydrolipoamide acetyltransferase family protein, partial [Longimicrobiales bacterium]|nr:dihydrolipoamide acetyltransferase family protein [Longimicrobiales bacterium]
MPKIEVPMPQMGESIAEGTVSRWLKQPGEAVERDEPILEISTDKVDAEIPAPSAGVLVDIQVQEGETVEVGTVVAFIDTEAAAGAGGNGGPAPAEPKAGKEAEPEREEEAESEAAPAPETEAASAGEAEASEPKRQPARQAAQADGGGGDETADERLRRRSTPLVRRIAAENDVDLAQVEGSGRAGRVTKQDIMAFLDERGEAPTQGPAAPSRAPARQPAPAGGAMGADQLWDLFYGKVRHPEFPVREGDDVQPMDRIRKLTADHMVLAKRVAPHVHSFIEIDFTRIDRIRRANKARWAQQGAKVSYTAFVAWGIARVLPEFPMVNGTVSGDRMIHRGSINIGIAVDLNPGLIVPVIRDADDLTLTGVAKRITDLAGRARDRKLKPDEIQGATFSITNPGVLGTYVGMPIIPEGTSAILGTGSIEKRPVVIEADGTDTIAIRLRCMFSLGYDHRIVDGADAARFLARVKEVLETFPEEVA